MKIRRVDVLIPLLQERYKLAVVYNGDNKLVGQVNSGDILSHVRPDGDLTSVMERASIIDAGERMVHLRRKMLDENLSRFVVMADSKVVGLVSETDVAVAMRKFRETVEERHQDFQIRNVLTQDIMSSPVISIEPGTSVDTVVTMMLSKSISGVPVMDKGKVIGMVTRQSLIKAL